MGHGKRVVIINKIYRKLNEIYLSFIGAVRQIVTRWHYNETLTLTVTLKLTVIYGVKEDTKTKLQLMLYIKVILLGKGVGS